MRQASFVDFFSMQRLRRRLRGKCVANSAQDWATAIEHYPLESIARG
jgi:hypothetical protein